MNDTLRNTVRGLGSDGQRRRAQWLLAAGAVGGIGLAMSSLLGAPVQGELPEGVVARVGDALIRADDYQRALAALAGDRKAPLEGSDRRHVLDRLIDEELLVQYGESLGLARSDRRIRGDYVSAVIAAQVAAVDGTAPSDSQLAEFYRDNRDFFASPGRLWVRSIWVTASSPAEALARGREAAARLRAGEPVESVDRALGSPQVAPVPDTPLPPVKLREYLGPAALEAARALAEGEVSEPLVSEAGVRVLVLVAAQPGASPPLEAVADEVRSEMKRRAGDAALRELLDQLRRDSHVLTVDVAP